MSWKCKSMRYSWFCLLALVISFHAQWCRILLFIIYISLFLTWLKDFSISFIYCLSHLRCFINSLLTSILFYFFWKIGFSLFIMNIRNLIPLIIYFKIIEGKYIYIFHIKNFFIKVKIKIFFLFLLGSVYSWWQTK